MAEDVPPVEHFGARSVTCSETPSKNGDVAGLVFDTSIACTVQSARVMNTNGAENCNGVDAVNPNGSPEVLGPKGKPSIWRANQASESVDVTKNECAPNLVVSDSLTEDGKTGERLTRRYSRSVLEALRFVDVDKQREKWDAVYKGLECSREYDEILTSTQKKVNWNYDHHQRQDKKKEASTTKREMSAENSGKVSSAPEISSLLCSSIVDEESWAVEEEQCTDDDSDDEHESIQRPAFYVEGEPDFESGPPEDGWEYLRRVRPSQDLRTQLIEQSTNQVTETPARIPVDSTGTFLLCLRFWTWIVSLGLQCLETGLRPSKTHVLYQGTIVCGSLHFVQQWILHWMQR